MNVMHALSYEESCQSVSRWDTMPLKIKYTLKPAANPPFCSTLSRHLLTFSRNSAVVLAFESILNRGSARSSLSP